MITVGVAIMVTLQDAATGVFAEILVGTNLVRLWSVSYAKMTPTQGIFLKVTQSKTDCKKVAKKTFLTEGCVTILTKVSWVGCIYI